MLWITLIIALLIAAAALLFVVWPLLQTGDEPIWIDDDRLSDLLGRKDSALRAIKELEFDSQVGKVSEADYARFNDRLRRQAIGYIQQIERLTPYNAALEEELEVEIARQRRTVNDSVDVEAETQSDSIAARDSTAAKTTSDSAATLFCTECGRPVAAGQRFCGHCGNRLLLEEETPGVPIAQEG